MRVVIATAEPRGAYHLRAVAAAMHASGHSFCHLIPYAEIVQGEPWTDTQADLAALDGCDRLVITGGSYSAWTLAVAWHAHTRGVPTVFSELAYVPTDPAGTLLPPLQAVSAMAPSGAAALSSYLGVEMSAIAITGNPILDTLPIRTPEQGTVLIVSTDLPHLTDPDGHLRELAHRLRDSGRRVLISPHPREDTSAWAGFDIQAGMPAAYAAAQAAVAVGYLGSAAPQIAASGCPFIALDPIGERGNLEAGHRAATSGWATTADEALALINTAAPVPDNLVHHAVGPLGGSAARVVDFWTKVA